MGIFGKSAIFAFLFLLVLDFSSAWRSFHHGRRRHGNLGDPNSTPKLFSAPLPPEQWFSQLLDHFDPTNPARWKQRYYVNDEFYKPGGPVFLMIGGEGEATAKWMKEGAWIGYARKFHALCFQLEHRFYGKSHPTKDLSTENLRFLSSEQALADLAYFITAMNEQYRLQAGTRWIAFGGSYPGSLAAWLRQKYPNLVHGSISSSGPLLAQGDFREYFDVVVDSLSTYSDACVKAVRKSFEQVELLLRHMIGQRSLTEKFQLCDPAEQTVNNELDVSNLFESLASNFAGVVQYNKDNSPHATVTIDDICKIMVNTSAGVPVTRLAAINSILLKKANETCLDYKYDKMITEMRNISWEAETSEGGRQWTYQTCTEFGFYQTSDDPGKTFGGRFPVEFFVRQCSDIFGKNFNNASLGQGIARTNTYYGALDPETTNVLYVHGSIDPWHALGLTNSRGDQMPAIYINGTAHCANMYEPKDTDFPQLKEARKKIVKYLQYLLSSH